MSQDEPYEDWHVALERYVKSYYLKDREAQLREAEIKGIEEGKFEAVCGMLKENIPLETALKCAGISKLTYEAYLSVTKK